MNNNETIKVLREDRKLLALYKLEHDLVSYSAAIRHAVERAETYENGPNTTSQS